MAPLRDRTAWLRGGGAVCAQPPTRVWRAWRLVLLGPPGVGKGTLSSLLFNALGTCPLSTGELFRAARGHTTAADSAMAEAQAQMNRGELVADATVLQVLRERSRCLHCQGGFLLDGFPRTLDQAHALDSLLETEGVRLDAVVNLELSASQLVTRLSGRRVCPRCTAIYHLTARCPRVIGVCDECGGSLVRRPDDQPESVCVQLASFSSRTLPVAEHYRQRGMLVTVDASGDPVDILAHTLDGLATLGLPA